MINRKKIVEELVQNMHAIRHKQMVGYNIKKQFPITPSQGFVLRYVAKNSPSNVKSIADTLQISSSAATQLIDGLVVKGYLVRKGDRDDRRVVDLSMSEKAKKLFQEFREQGLQKMAAIFEALTDDELVQYASLNKKIADTVNK